MHLRAILTTFALASPALASVLNLNIYTDSLTDKTDVVKTNVKDDQKALVVAEVAAPKWRKRDTNHLVPLIPGAKTEALPVVYEEGLTYALGPRFANEFIQAALDNQNGSHIMASCNPLKCASTVIKAAPCIAAAPACKCVQPLLICPTVKLGDLCSCVDCLPALIREWIQKAGICSGKFDDMPALPAEDDPETDYPEFIAYSTRSTNLLAYRGDLALSTLAEAKAVAATGLCPGSSCGSCSCCLGVCVPVIEQCLGVCLPFPGEKSIHSDEL